MPPTNSSGNTSKSTKSLIITLKVASSSLKKFPHEKLDEAVDSPSSSNQDSSSKNDKKSGSAASKPALKRTASQAAVDDGPKARGKPGPKKKLKVDAVNGTSIPVSAPKINPKANTGAINANLRALDRSGAPCRRWNLSGFKVRSFTGVVWGAQTWGAPKQTEVKDGSSDFKSMDSSQTSDQDTSAGDTKPIKPNGVHSLANGSIQVDSSAVPSERSVNGERGTPLNGTERLAASSIHVS